MPCHLISSVPQAREDIPAHATILPNAIEALASPLLEQNQSWAGEHLCFFSCRLWIYGDAVKVNHCWDGNTVLLSKRAALFSPGVGGGGYFAFALVAGPRPIAAGTELVSDYREAPWFIRRADRSWRCGSGAEQLGLPPPDPASDTLLEVGVASAAIAAAGGDV
eukprot:SAG22_NODE_3674_length_1583_cov_12.278302_1_plen_164_part_00